MKYNVLMIGICLVNFILMTHGYLDLKPLRNMQDNDKINGRKLLFDFLKQDSLYDDSQYIPFTQYTLKYNNRGVSGDIKRTERGLTFNDLHRLNNPILTKPKQTKYTRSNCFLSPVQCSFFLP